MHRLRIPTLAILLFAFAVPASGRDLCFGDSFGNVFVLQKVKRLKKPGKSAPVRGYALLSGASEIVPLSGTAVASTDGEVQYGVTIHGLFYGTDQSVAGAWNPTTGQLAVHYDSDGDGSANASDQWVPLDCDTVVLP